MDLSNENVIHVKINKEEYLQFRKLLEYKDKITHAYSIGIDKNYRTAKPNKEKINNEEETASIKSYENLCKALTINYKNIVKANQEHTDIVQIVENKILTNMPDINLKKYDRTDGLITNKKEIILSTTNADCILILFYDPIKNVIGNTHSGWKGTLQQISVKTIQKMVNEFGCNEKDIICCICPSIRKCHFEVDKDVKDMFEKEFSNLSNIENIIEKQGNKWHIDTVEINKKILMEKGIQEKNIIDSKICSVCNCKKIHSYRVEKNGYGLNTAIIEIKN